MEKIYYNKLCRDNVPEIIRNKGFECEIRVVEDAEFRREIIRKVLEEATGVSNQKNPENLLKEMADLVITIDAVKKEFGITDEMLSGAVSHSLSEKGGYTKHQYISWSSDTEYSSHDHGAGLDD
ncbi:MAG TPA: nucleoside triphosphate pyrophosphohydrolase [Candidatus Paceibacterota bacterium]|nr:nucleoside triphosphate pyrophosphohydrolase [Candidatus Paceibacterota bacterium]